ncbi:MAG: sulfite exporter TauE/SafE family protein [Bacteroidota bacterium]
MPDFSSLLNSPLQWSLFFFCAVMVGMSKTGLQGIGTLTIPILAFLFGAKNSTGILLPILCMADIVAVVYYRRNTRFIYILKLIPWAVAGLFVAIAVDKFIHPAAFKKLMAVCILLGLAVMFWSEHRNKVDEMAASKWFGPAFGIMGGFTTMIGNAAGPIMSVYLLSMRLPKYLFISTAAWFFLVINYLKLPLQIFFWKNITIHTFLLDLTAIPFVFLGAFAGVKLVAWLPEKNFRMVIVVLTIVSTLMLLY